MNKITKNNIEEFINYYHYFHDSNINNVNYDILNSKIEIYIDVFWSGEPLIKEGVYYETNKTKIKIILSGIEQCNIKEIYSINNIEEAYLKYIKLNNKEFICFASDFENPLFYIVCDNMGYEEIKK